jgi:hypothetical protein
MIVEITTNVKKVNVCREPDWMQYVSLMKTAPLISVVVTWSAAWSQRSVSLARGSWSVKASGVVRVRLRSVSQEQRVMCAPPVETIVRRISIVPR